MSLSELLGRYGPEYLLALLTTWKLTVLAFSPAFLLGVLVTVLRISPIRPLQWAGEGMTMVVISHEMGFARRVASRVFFMDQGAIVEEAPPEAFFSRPKTRRAREFLSSIQNH